MGLALCMSTAAQRGRGTFGGAPASPTSLSAAFDIPTISGQVSWTDNSGGAAQYEVYSSYNGNPYVFLGTTAVGATSYIDTTCKQNASVVYRIRAKKGGTYSEYVTTSVINTPLCWKTDQTVRTNVIINQLNIAAGKTVNIDWGDGTNANYTGNNTNITKTYDANAVNIFNIKLSGDTDSITYFSHNSQAKSYGDVSSWVLPSLLQYFYINSTGVSGDISSWVLPSLLQYFYINSTGVSGDISNWVLPSSLIGFSVSLTGVSGDISSWVLPSSLQRLYINSTGVSGALPNITSSASALNYQAQASNMSSTNITAFRGGMNYFNISYQKVSFPTSEIDKLLKAAADWYQLNPPVANCTYDLKGANMGIPTGGTTNVDIVRLIEYYSAAGFAATIICRTS